MVIAAGIVLTILMVAGFSYASRGFVYDLFAPTASKEVMRRANSRPNTNSYRRY